MIEMFKKVKMKKKHLIPALAFCVLVLIVSFYHWKPYISAEPGISGKNKTSEKFTIKRGINISHWLSQNNDQSFSRSNLFTESDVIFLKEKGYDHLRIPVDEENLWNIDGVKQLEAFQLLHNAIGWCQKHNLRVIIDLHIIRSHSFNNKKNLLWESTDAKNHFIQLWLQLSDEFKKYPINLLAYELLNEAVAEKASDWNELVKLTLFALRKTEPNRMVVVGSNMWQSPNTFHELDLPENDKNIIVSFHFYTPMIFTHYKASWCPFAKYVGSVEYPGQAVNINELIHYDKDLVDEVNKHNGFFTPDTLLKLIQEPIEYAKKNGIQLYCGEFGCLPTVHRSARLQWYKDVRTIFETNNISWSNWDYKGGFAIFNQQTGLPDEYLINVLLGKITDAKTNNN
jgi:endoglucanase